MPSLSYNRSMNDGCDYYGTGRFVEAYEFITVAPNLVGNLSRVRNFQFCLASIAGKSELALEIAISKADFFDKAIELIRPFGGYRIRPIGV